MLNQIMEVDRNKTYHEERKVDENVCRYCHRAVPFGKLFDHESNCNERVRNSPVKEPLPRTAAGLGAITHPGKPMKQAANNWRSKHQEFITAIKLGK